MDENTFQKKMAELIQRIQDLPGTSPGNEGPQGTEDPAGNGLQGPLGELQESLDYLRLSVKYLVFDLEATRRETPDPPLGGLAVSVEEEGVRDRVIPGRAIEQDDVA